MAADVEVNPSISGSIGPPAEVEQLRAYLLRSTPVLLEEDVLPDTDPLQKELKSSELKLRKFIEDPQERVLFIVRALPPEGAEGENGDFQSSYSLRLGLSYHPARCTGVCFIKRGTALEADKTIRSQLRLMSFSEDSPFETLHSYVKDAVTPYFASFVMTTKKIGYASNGCGGIYYLRCFSLHFCVNVVKRKFFLLFCDDGMKT